jgi:tRNA U34 5-carboxymethylaminomethyl modifying GTPase MnmE/TrmE
MLDDFRQQKVVVQGCLNDLAQVASQLGMESLHADIVDLRLPKLAEERFSLVVLGEFNHGKTTFVNALLGEEILPAGITPTTAAINHIVWSERTRAHALLRDGVREEIPLSRLADYVTIEGKHAERIRYVELGYPAELLKERITLVDTPGVNDINEARAEVTYTYIPRADAVIFLLDSSQVLKQSERSFIKQRLLRHDRDKLLFVLGKRDLLTAAEQAETLAFAEKHLSALIPEPMIFSVSPKQYLDPALREASGMEPLVAFLRRYLQEERGRILIDNAIADGQRIVQYLRASLGIKRGSLQLSLDQLTARIAEVHEQLEGSRRSLREIHKRIESESEAVKATIRHDLRLFVAEFCEVLPKQIEGADASDVKRYLQSFIQDKFKEWAEAEGDKIAVILQQLAEDVIKVMSENIHQVLDAVSMGLCADDTRVDLEVDTLKYDAGVFALGALGTTIFLFVNTFVGGLLTIAAPVLAVVLRERVGAQIKRQAKEKAPAVIQSAAQAIQPRFEEIVDQFSSRLADFVNNAGEALHRGISEILDRVLDERKAREHDIEGLTRDLDREQQALAGIDARLQTLREGIWTK